MAAPRGLHALARLHGVQTAYTSADGRRVNASPESLMAALRALGVPVATADDIPRLTEHRRRELAERVIEPVVVAWERPPAARPRSAAPRPGSGAVPDSGFLLRLPADRLDTAVQVRVTLEEGGEREWAVTAGALEVVDEAEVDGRSWATLQVPLPPLPAGYHDLAVEVDGGRREALLLAAPRLAPGWDRIADRPAWGVFAPLYALHEERSGPRLPDFSLLDRLAARVAAAGGAVVGTLPVLAAFLDDPLEPSPYAPVSRLFWNELYADPARAPGWSDLPEEARGGAEPADAAGGRALDHHAAMAARRPRLEALARAFFRNGDPPEIASFRARNPRADDYAVFRALVERHGAWSRWPDRLRARDVRPGDYDEEVARYHLYAQWLAERQLAEATERAASLGVSLYLDLPVGVHPDGYDVWRDRALFGRGVSAGAPPDPLAAHGQDWGFPPLHPEASRLERHRYLVASIRKHLRFARVLRIDHVMQLHRMFWVPGGDARNGVYVRYPAEELYAILSLEAHRAGAVIVGEDLGTVPAEVRRGMKRHGLAGMYVAEFELKEQQNGGTARHQEDSVLVPGPVPAGAVASIGTHDTPTFAGWWRGRDLEIRRELGLLEPEEAEEELRGRAEMRRKLAAGLGIESGRRLGVRAGGGGGGGGPVDGAAGSPLPGLADRAGKRGSGGAGRADEVDADVEVDVEAEVLARLHDHMARSPAGLVLATMEDLWLEAEPQNVPGTTGERNWRRRSVQPLEALEEAPAAGLLQKLEDARRALR